MKTKAALKMKVANPMSILVHKAIEYDIELIGVVPKVYLIENETPKAIINRPPTKKTNFILIAYLKLIKAINSYTRNFKKVY